MGVQLSIRLIFSQVPLYDLITNLTVYVLSQQLLGKILLSSLHYARNKVLQDV